MKVINIKIEIFDGTDMSEIQDIIGDALNENGVDCSYDVEENIED